MSDEKFSKIEAIDFETLQDTTQKSHKTTTAKKFPLTWIIFLFLIISMAAVFIYLPNYVEKKQELAEQKEKQSSSITAPKVEPLPKEFATEHDTEQILSTEKLAVLKAEAEQLLLEIIQKQETLEQHAVSQWAENEFLNALSIGEKGDEEFRQQNYTSAIEHYSKAVAELNILEKRIAPTLENYVQKGEFALSEADKELAIYNFELALKIDKHNQRAISGIKRAATIEELFKLLKKGGNLEAGNRLNDAQDTYQEAMELDPLSEQAKIAFERVSQRLQNIEFSNLLASGDKLLKTRQYADAKHAYRSALKINPQSKEAKQGIINVDQAIRKDKVMALFAEAKIFENNEDWLNASTSYQQILNLNPASASAHEGKLRCEKHAEILTQLNSHIENYLRLSNENVAAEANQLLVAAKTLSDPGNKILSSSVKVRHLLEHVKQPIELVLTSNNETEVAIYKVGKLGKFQQRDIELKPGKYTFVGSRTGYRDVRKVLIVSAEMTTRTVEVSCEEPI